MPRKKGPYVEQAYTYIKERIITFEMVPGMVISDHALEGKLNMSRSPIREAMMLLMADGLIEIIDGKMCAATMTMKDIIDICQVRRAVEVAALDIVMGETGRFTDEQKEHISQIYEQLKQSAELMVNYMYDDLFHGAITAATGNKRLCEISDRMRLQISRARWLNLVIPHRHEAAAEEHRRLYMALMSDDLAASKRYLCEHLDNSESNFKHVLLNPAYDIHFAERVAALQITRD